MIVVLRYDIGCCFIVFCYVRNETDLLLMDGCSLQVSIRGIENHGGGRGQI